MALLTRYRVEVIAPRLDYKYTIIFIPKSSFMAKNFETPDFSRVAKETMRHIVHIAAVEGLRFFQDRFMEQGWKPDFLANQRYSFL